jgi:hypothetical protein
MPVYMCRWENGEVSFVSARSKRGACLLLDKFAAVEPEDLHEVQDFMLSFALSDDGEVVLSRITVKAPANSSRRRSIRCFTNRSRKPGRELRNRSKLEDRESGQRSRKSERGFRAR